MWIVCSSYTGRNWMNQMYILLYGIKTIEYRCFLKLIKKIELV